MSLESSLLSVHPGTTLDRTRPSMAFVHVVLSQMSMNGTELLEKLAALEAATRAVGISHPASTFGQTRVIT